MKTLREIQRRSPIWVNPKHTVESAVILMKGHKIGSLAVMEGDNLMGMIYYDQLLGTDPNLVVEELVRKDIPSLDVNMSIKEAAQVMTIHKLGRLPVLEQDRLVGVVSQGDLLPEIGRSIDPLTELPWSDSMREWAIENLKRGIEITVLFIDLDNFGQFNKQYGHIVGDQVLKSVAEIISSLVDDQSDFLCRYGGDEFCITTIRPADDASDLALRIHNRIKDMNIDTLDTERVSCTIGQFGGKRIKEREHVHYAATLNSLINLASKDCTEQKKPSVTDVIEDKAVVKTLPVRLVPRLRLANVDLVWKGYKAQVHVELELAHESDAGVVSPTHYYHKEGINRFSATASSETDEDGALRLVAETTASALRSFLPDGYDVVIGDVIYTQSTGEGSLITVVGKFVMGQTHVTIAGSAVVTESRHRASASAVLAAVNRSIGVLIQGIPSSS